jgi:hypothetical protein
MTTVLLQAQQTLRFVGSVRNPCVGVLYLAQHLLTQLNRRIHRHDSYFERNRASMGRSELIGAGHYHLLLPWANSGALWTIAACTV